MTSSCSIKHELQFFIFTLVFYELVYRFVNYLHVSYIYHSVCWSVSSVTICVFYSHNFSSYIICSLSIKKYNNIYCTVNLKLIFISTGTQSYSSKFFFVHKSVLLVSKSPNSSLYTKYRKVQYHTVYQVFSRNFKLSVSQ